MVATPGSFALAAALWHAGRENCFDSVKSVKTGRRQLSFWSKHSFSERAVSILSQTREFFDRNVYGKFVRRISHRNDMRLTVV